MVWEETGGTPEEVWALLCAVNSRKIDAKRGVMYLAEEMRVLPLRCASLRIKASFWF